MINARRGPVSRQCLNPLDSSYSQQIMHPDYLALSAVLPLTDETLLVRPELGYSLRDLFPQASYRTYS